MREETIRPNRELKCHDQRVGAEQPAASGVDLELRDQEWRENEGNHRSTGIGKQRDGPHQTSATDYNTGFSHPEMSD
jgi:hypothetical protein